MNPSNHRDVLDPNLTKKELNVCRSEAILEIYQNTLKESLSQTISY